jgi:hypothetical protein
MKNIYFLLSKKWLAAALVVATFLFVCANSVFSQTVKPFTQRTSINSPTQTIYSIKGDFALMGNTNLTLQTYSDDEPNSNNNMVYVDVDGDANTKNSSSATLQFSTENGAVPACSNIIYAGLYWTGRAHDGGESPLIFNVGGSATNYNNNANIGGYTLAIAQSQSGSVYTATYTFTPTIILPENRTTG